MRTIVSPTMLGLMLSSKDYHAGEPNWRALGAGVWDTDHRPSFVRLDRVLVIVADHIRREGAVLDRSRLRRSPSNCARTTAGGSARARPGD